MADENCNRLWNVPCHKSGCTDLFCETKERLLSCVNPYRHPHRITFHMPYQTPQMLFQNSQPVDFQCPIEMHIPCTRLGCNDLYCEYKKDKARKLAEAAFMQPILPVFSQPRSDVSPIGPSSEAASMPIFDPLPPVFSQPYTSSGVSPIGPSSSSDIRSSNANAVAPLALTFDLDNIRSADDSSASAAAPSALTVDIGDLLKFDPKFMK